MSFDPEKKPREPTSVRDLLAYRRGYFDPKIGEDEDGFTHSDAESLGWSVQLFHASKPFPGLGLVEVHAGGGVLDSDEGGYGILKSIYDFELGQHRRAQGRARETYLRLVRAERQKLQALNAAKAAREEAPACEPGQATDEEWAAHNAAHERESKARQEAIKQLRQANKYLEELCAFDRLELPEEFLDELREEESHYGLAV